MRYEVTFHLDTDDDRISSLREAWTSIGDHIEVVGGDPGWECLVHTDDIGAAIEAGIACGTPRNIRVVDLREHPPFDPPVDRSGGFEPSDGARAAAVGVVAVAAGAGILEVFKDRGVQGVVMGSPSSNPGVDDLLSVVDEVPAKRVIVLPNSNSIVPVAEQLDALTTKEVVVVPTRSVPQGIAAMMGYTTDEDDVEVVAETMSAAASSVVHGEVTLATRDAKVPYGPIARGDWVGIADGTVLVADPDLETTLRQLVAGLWLDGSELVTIYTGAGSLPAATKALEAWIADVHTGTEVSVVDGGQPSAPYLVSIE